MEYFRVPHNKIQAGFALHAGKLLMQYQGLPRQNHENYEATLLICVLHSLLSSCAELVAATRMHHRTLLAAPVYDIPRLWGISRQFVTKYTFPGELSYERFIGHMRNAVSHPTSADKEPFHPSTGYTTIPNGSGIISSFLFIDSPWVDRGRIHSRYCSTSQERITEEAKRFELKYGNAGLLIRRKANGCYEIIRDDETYLPIFQAELTIQSLELLAIELSNLLALPTKEDWDGKTVHRLVA